MVQNNAEANLHIYRDFEYVRKGRAVSQSEKKKNLQKDICQKASLISCFFVIVPFDI